MPHDSKSSAPWARFLLPAFYLAWMARDLPGAWRNDPLNEGGAVAFVIWLFAVALCVAFGRRSRRNFEFHEKWLLAAVLLATLGAMGDLNVLGHLGLSLGACSILPLKGHRFLLLVASFSWMPALAWIGQRLESGPIDGGRVAILLFTTLLGAIWYRSVLFRITPGSG